MPPLILKVSLIMSRGTADFYTALFLSFPQRDTMDFFEELGVPLKVERGNRVFPVSDKAVDIVDALNKFVTINGVKRKPRALNP